MPFAWNKTSASATAIHDILAILYRTRYNLLLQVSQPDSHGVRVSLESLPFSQRDDDGTEDAESVLGELLRGDVLLERERVDTAELSGVAVRREGVICSGCVVTATWRKRLAGY